jgi:hypothetical protein
MNVDCSLLVRLHDIHVDCCPVIDLGIFISREFKEVNSKNLGIQLSNYTSMRFMRQLDGSQNSPRIVFKEDASKGCYWCLVLNLCVLHLVYVFDFSLVRLIGGGY